VFRLGSYLAGDGMLEVEWVDVTGRILDVVLGELVRAQSGSVFGVICGGAGGRCWRVLGWGVGIVHLSSQLKYLPDAVFLDVFHLVDNAHVYRVDVIIDRTGAKGAVTVPASPGRKVVRGDGDNRRDLHHLVEELGRGLSPRPEVAADAFLSLISAFDKGG